MTGAASTLAPGGLICCQLISICCTWDLSLDRDLGERESSRELSYPEYPHFPALSLPPVQAPPDSNSSSVSGAWSRADEVQKSNKTLYGEWRCEEAANPVPWGPPGPPGLAWGQSGLEAGCPGLSSSGSWWEAMLVCGYICVCECVVGTVWAQPGALSRGVGGNRGAAPLLQEGAHAGPVLQFCGQGCIPGLEEGLGG